VRRGYPSLVPVAIVTGSDSGIGKATAVQLAEDGYDIGITWHADEDGAREAAAECQSYGVRTAARRMDLEADVGQAAVVDELADDLGGVDVFVNNAGGGHGAPVLELGLDDWQRTIDLGLTGAFLCLQRAGRRMAGQGRGGRLIAVTSIHEHLPLRDNAAYGAAKGGLGMLVKSLALELGPLGITANAVAPGEIATKMTGQEDEAPVTRARSPRPSRSSPRPRVPTRRATPSSWTAGWRSWARSPTGADDGAAPAGSA
jgi:NAD(P)-dependent dehydrogenase (short-subunit alcohol dehydrogenase family)